MWFLYITKFLLLFLGKYFLFFGKIETKKAKSKYKKKTKTNHVALKELSFAVLEKT